MVAYLLPTYQRVSSSSHNLVIAGAPLDSNRSTTLMGILYSSTVDPIAHTQVISRPSQTPMAGLYVLG
jgi:hypothetical protein